MRRGPPDERYFVRIAAISCRDEANDEHHYCHEGAELDVTGKDYRRGSVHGECHHAGRELDQGNAPTVFSGRPTMLRTRTITTEVILGYICPTVSARIKAAI
jgi:hypothetical protein